MKTIGIFVLLASFILAVSKAVMNMIKKEDERNGLYINEKEYGVFSSLRLSRNQDKRIEKETENKDYPVDESMWKKCMIIILSFAALSLILGITFSADIAGPVILLVAASYVYSQKSYKILVITDIIAFILMFTNYPLYTFPIMIMFPPLLVFTYVVRKDYKKSKNKEV